MRTVRAAFRFVTFTAATLGLYAVWFAANPFVSDKRRWRQWIFGAWTNSFVRISNMKIEVTGTPPTAPFFLVTNHLSYTDIGAIRAAVTGIFVAKKEVESWFLAGRICRDMGTIFIDRSNRRDIPRAGEKIIERLEHGEGVIVFPEGTSTKGDEVLTFNSSFFEFAAKSGIPVSYASLTYRTPTDEPPASMTVTWWDDIGFFAHLWRLFRIYEYTAILNFGDKTILHSDRKQLAKELQRSVAKSFVPVK